MDVYLFTLGLGFGGLLLMAVLGLGHHQHGSGHHHGGAHGPHGHHHGGGKEVATHHASPSSAKFLTLLSPRVLCSLALGFGATGLLLRPTLGSSLSGWQLAALAAGGSWVFERLLVQPVWRLLFNFASKPARTLDSAVFEEGEAAMNFDAAGHGLMVLQLDGQVHQLLATLCPEDRAAGLRVRTGDRLFIRAVDLQRNRCTVSKTL